MENLLAMSGYLTNEAPPPSHQPPGEPRACLGQRIMPFGNSRDESQRDSGSKPRVARHELPWGQGPQVNNPNGVAARRRKGDTTPLGLAPVCAGPQGSSLPRNPGLEDTIPLGLHKWAFSRDPLTYSFAPHFQKAAGLRICRRFGRMAAPLLR